MTHVMLDLETWGTRPGCAIRSIGAVVFDPWHPQPDADFFYANVWGESCIAAGLHIEAGTAEWWEDQSPEARAHLGANPLPLRRAMEQFQAFFMRNRGRYVWGHGASFDAPILGEAFRRLSMSEPWNFWNLRDTRTVYDMAELRLGDFPREGTHHNALDDARHQVRVLQAAYKKLGLANG